MLIFEYECSRSFQNKIKLSAKSIFINQTTTKFISHHQIFCAKIFFRNTRTIRNKIAFNLSQNHRNFFSRFVKRQKMTRTTLTISKHFPWRRQAKKSTRAWFGIFFTVTVHRMEKQTKFSSSQFRNSVKFSAKKNNFRNKCSVWCSACVTIRLSVARCDRLWRALKARHELACQTRIFQQSAHVDLFWGDRDLGECFGTVKLLLIIAFLIFYAGSFSSCFKNDYIIYFFNYNVYYYFIYYIF